MRILLLDDVSYNLETLPEEIDDMRFSILDNSIIQPGFNIVTTEPKEMDKLREYLSGSTSNETNLTDTIPFKGIDDWFRTNLGNGVTSSKSDLYNTTKVLLVNDEKKMIANFKSSTSSTDVRPITNFNYISFDKPSPTQENLKSFYLSKPVF